MCKIDKELEAAEQARGSYKTRTMGARAGKINKVQNLRDLRA
jgi:hypothetical protein